MADTKISALPASTTPLAGTEVLPIVQSSATKQVSVANLTAGRAISATQLTLTTGNLIVASGQGIDFSATSHPAGMTSELLADYEEGTFIATATADTGTITLSTNTLRYTKTGRTVNISGVLVVGSVSSPTGNVFFTLPFTAGFSCGGGIAIDGTNAFTGDIGYFINAAQSNFYIFYRDITGASNVSGPIFKASTVIRLDLDYTV